ncbi:MAG TPA: YXWGXW repeat-containing protein, partial [Steroidobacteraceae bacterium]
MRKLIQGITATLLLAALPLVSQAAVFVGLSVNIAPPALPVYVQPPCPAPGYMWIPGYWGWAGEDEGYYWVPGTWALAPVVGFLWTPGYWGWGEGAYFWHGGYWGRHVGFYGGINYGFGYGGVGYQGGYWRGREFYYNRSVTNINRTNITNVYNRTVVNNVNVNRVSFNGGTGGVAARPDAAQLAAGRERHVGFTPMQRQHEQLARGNQTLRASVNGGRPPIAATSRAGSFSARGTDRSAQYRPQHG